MKNNIRSKKIIGIILIAILAFTTNVYAASDSFKTTLSSNKSQAKRGENITITIGLKDIAIESGEKGIGAYTANINFDSSVLEYVSTSATGSWEAPFYQGGSIIGNTNNGEVVKTAQSVGTVTFKVKSNAKLGETTIKLTNFTGSTVASDVITADNSIKITITDSSAAGNNNNNSNNNGSSNGENQNNNENVNGDSKEPTNTNTQSEKNNNSNNSEDVKQGTLPQTGHTNILIYTSIALCALVAIDILLRIKILNKKIRKHS